MEVEKLASLLKQADRYSCDHLLVCDPGNHGMQAAVDSAVFPLVTGGNICLRIADLSRELRRYFIEHKKLPRSAVYPILKKIGFGHKYLPADPKRIRAKEHVDLCISELLSGGRRGMLLTGPPGTGKTTIMRWIAEQLITKSQCRIKPAWLRFVPVSRLYEMIFRRAEDELHGLKEVSYLFIDDFGQAYESDYSAAMFESLICYRYDNLKPTFLTTNKSVEDLRRSRIWERLVDRMRDRQWMQAPLSIGGKSMRGVESEK